MITSFGLTFIDAFGNNNIINDSIISLPAILSVSWFTNGFFTITVKDKNGNVVTEHSGPSEKASTQFWDLQLTTDSEIWHVHILFEQSDTGLKEEVTKLIKIDSKSIKSPDEEYSVPPIDDITDFDQVHRFKELDAHWLKVDPEKNLFRFVFNDVDKPIQDPSIEWFTPILLIHGFKSNHLTWNSMVRYIWLDGFRNIYTTEILEPSDIEANIEYLGSITDFIFELTGLKKIIIIAHSIGSWIAKFFVNQPNQKENILLFVSIASPQYGLFKGMMSSVYSMMGKVQKLHKELNDENTNLFYQKSESNTSSKSNYNLGVNVNGSVLKLGGSDGVFKPQIVPEMINFVFNHNHLMLNKCQETIMVVSDLLLKKAKIYKLELVSITPNPKAKKKSFSFTMKSKNPLDSKKTHLDQVYPREGFIELEENQSFTPHEPLVIFVGYETTRNEIDLYLEIYNKIHTFDCKEKFVIPLAHSEPVTKSFIITTKSNYSIKFESYSFKLVYELID